MNFLEAIKTAIRKPVTQRRIAEFLQDVSPLLLAYLDPKHINECFGLIVVIIDSYSDSNRIDPVNAIEKRINDIGCIIDSCSQDRKMISISSGYQKTVISSSFLIRFVQANSSEAEIIRKMFKPFS